MTPLEKLRRLTQATSQSQVARDLGVSQPHVNKLLRGVKKFSPKMLALLGYERVTSVTYRRVK